MAGEISPFNAQISLVEITPDPAVLARAANLLRDHDRRILRAWASHVGALPTFRERPQLALEDVLGAMPTLLDALRSFVENPNGSDFPLDRALSNSDAHGHGAARASIGFTAQDIVLEYRLLRQVLWRELTLPPSEEAEDRSHLSADDVTTLQSLVNGYLDTLLAATLTGWSQVNAVTD